MPGHQLVDAASSGDEEQAHVDDVEEIDDTAARSSVTQKVVAILKLSLPVIGQYVLQFMNFSIPFLFLGRVSPAAMGAFALSQMFVNCTSNALGYGFVTALDTIVSQAWGAKNYTSIGLAVQRSVVIMTLFCLPFVVIWNVVPGILFPYLSVDKEVCRLAKLHCRVMISGIWPGFIYDIQKKYLANQKITLPPVLAMIPSLILNVLLNFFFIPRYGFVVAPISICASNWLMCVLLFGYIRWRGLHRKTWPTGGWCNSGWDVRCLRRWPEIFRLGTPGALMLVLEWGVFEVNAFLAARLGANSLATHSVLAQSAGLLFMAPLGMSVAVATLVGNSLGGGDAKGAKAYCYIGLCIGIVTNTIQNAIVCFLLRDIWPMLYTSDSGVRSMVSKMLIIFFFFTLPDQARANMAGSLRGMGKQMLGATINLLSYPVIGLPISWYLSSRKGMGVRGIWFGMTLGVTIAAMMTFGYLVLFVDWKKEADLAVQRSIETTSSSKPAEQRRRRQPGERGGGGQGADIEFQRIRTTATLNDNDDDDDDDDDDFGDEKRRQEDDEDQEGEEEERAAVSLTGPNANIYIHTHTYIHINNSPSPLRTCRCSSPLLCLYSFHGAVFTLFLIDPSSAFREPMSRA